MIDLFLEALDAPPPGWSGRRRFIVQQLVRMVVEGLVFVACLLAFLAFIVVMWAAMLPAPQ